MKLSKLQDPSEKTLGIMLLAPAFVLLALIVVYPIGKLIYNSFFDLRLSGGSGAFKFVGLAFDSATAKAFWADNVAAGLLIGKNQSSQTRQQFSISFSSTEKS